MTLPPFQVLCSHDDDEVVTVRNEPMKTWDCPECGARMTDEEIVRLLDGHAPMPDGTPVPVVMT